MDQPTEQPTAVEIDIAPEQATGQFSNLCLIHSSNEHFVLDFASLMPGMPKPMVKSRIVVTPAHAKRIIAALTNQMKQFEENYGEVHKSEIPGYIPGMGGPTAQA